MSVPGPEPDDLQRLGERLDKVQRQRAARKKAPPPTSMGIAFRFATELFAALVVGAGLGWFLDRFLGTKPWLMVVFFVLGAAAGIRNVMRAAKELNAEMAAAPAAPAANDDEEN